MPYLKSLPDDAGPPNLFKTYPEIYRHWSMMSQELMNGPSSLNQGERELILAYAAGVAGCAFVCDAHKEVAYEWGVAEGLVDQLLTDPEAAPVDAKLRPLLGYVRKLAATPSEVSQADVDAVLAAGWDERAVHDAVAVTARAAFMQRLVQGFGFTPLPKDIARSHAKKRVERGYVNLYPAFSKES
ncbi:MAG: peroxidase [Rhodospirillaceae bacterium]|jgi:uncharacterized peroxidase-related enzyme|nr:peroxidase [Rhodospirillaceae bacterium]